MSYVVALLAQDTCKIFKDRSQVPAGAVVFGCAQDISATVPLKVMDSIRGRLLDLASVEPSPSHEVAAQRLWYVLSLGFDLHDKINWRASGYARAKDLFGKNKIKTTGPIELIKMGLMPGCSHMVRYFADKLPKQARQLISILAEDGRLIWTRDQAYALVTARESEFETVQGVDYLFQYYLKEFFSKKILYRVSYLEFLSKPEFKGLFLES